MHLLRPEVRVAYREAAKRTGLQVASLAISRTSEVPLTSDPQAAEWLAQSLDVCRGNEPSYCHAGLLRQGLVGSGSAPRN